MMMLSKKSGRTSEGSNLATDSKERSIDPPSPPSPEQASFGMWAHGPAGTDQAKTTVTTQGEATGPVVEALAAESTVNDEQIDVISKAGAPEAATEEFNESEAGAARQPTDDNKDSKPTKQGSDKAEDSKESSIDRGSHVQVADSGHSCRVTGQAKKTVSTEEGPTVGAESKLNDEQIDDTLKVDPPGACAEEVRANIADTTRRPRSSNEGNSNTNFGPATGVGAESITAGTVNSSVVQNAYHLMESSSKVKAFSTAEAPSHTFVGREEQLELVHQKLEEYCATQEHHMRRIVALISTPGMGKTEIARAFVQKYKDQYEHVAWIDASMDCTARACFVNLARLLKVDHSKDDEGKDLARLVYAHISNQFEKPSLFIFDNARRLETDGKILGIQDYLPTQVKRNLPLILVTSRSDEWRTYDCEVVDVTPLTKEESLHFFQSVFKLSEKKEDSKLNELLKQLADKLEGHPVRLKKAAKFISSIRGKPTLSRFKDNVRKCIKKADEMEFSAQIPEDIEVEELSAEKSAPTLNAPGLPTGSKGMNQTMAEQCDNAAITAKCVETFGKTMERRLSSLPFVDDAQFSEIQKAAEDETISLFREESRKIGDAQASQDQLMTKLAEKTAFFQGQNKMQEMLESHDAQMESKLENVYDSNTVQVIQNEMDVHVFKKMQDWLGLLQKRRQDSRWSEQVKANCERLEAEISTFLCETTRDYKRVLDPSKFRSEDEIAQVEPEVRSKAMDALQRISHKVPETKVSSLRADLIARLDEISEKAREEVKNNAEAVEEQLDITIKEAAAEYKKSMVGLLLSESGTIPMEGKAAGSSLHSTRKKVQQVFTTHEMPPIASADLEKFHRKSEAKAWKILSIFLDRNNKKFKIPTQTTEKSREALEASVSEAFSHFQKLHQKKMESVKAQALKEMTKAEQELTIEMKKLLESAMDEEHFDLEASLYKDQAKSRLETSLDVSVTGEKIFQDIVAQWDTKVEKLLNLYKRLMEKRFEQKRENLKARNCASKVEERFRAELEQLLAATLETFDSRASNLRKKHTAKLQHSMDVSNIGTQSAEEALSAWDHRVEDLIQLSKVAIRNPVQRGLESSKGQANEDMAKTAQKFGVDMENDATPLRHSTEGTEQQTQGIEHVTRVQAM